MVIPSINECGSPSIIERSMNAPGSPSSALQTTYLTSPLARAVNSHFRPVRNPAPPRPRNPELRTVSITSWGSISNSALLNAIYPSRAIYSSMFSGSIRPQFRKVIRTCLL